MQGVIFDFDSTPHWLYDLSLPLEKRIEERQYFPTGAAVANYLGVPPKTIWEVRRIGRTITSKIDSKKYAIRIVKQNEIQNGKAVKNYRRSA